MANISSVFDANKVFQGPAVVFIGPTGTTPADTPLGGGVMEVKFETSFEIVELYLGWPRILMKQYIKKKDVTVSFKTVEPTDYDVLRYALSSAAYTTPTSATEFQIDVGEQATMTECAIQLRILNVEGLTEEVYFWTCVGGNDSVSREYDDEGLHMPTYTFKVLRSLTKWGGDSLSEAQRLYRMIFMSA